MNYTLQVVIILLGMFIVTFVSAWLPFMIEASKKTMNLLAIFGGGILVGAALLIVLPESCKVVIDANYALSKSGLVETGAVAEDAEEEGILDESVTRVIGLATTCGFALMLIIDESFKIYEEYSIKHTKTNVRQTSLQHQDEGKERLLNGEMETNTIVVEPKVDAHPNKSTLVTTIGLVVHSLAEGFAMGSSLYRKYHFE